MDLSPLFPFSIQALQKNSTLDLPAKQRLQILRFLQKLGCQKPCWHQARVSSLVIKQFGTLLVSLLRNLPFKHFQTFLPLLFSPLLLLLPHTMSAHPALSRNEADKQSSTMQGFLTDSLLAWLLQADVSLRDQANSLDLLQQTLSSGLQGIQADRQAFLHKQKKLLLTANSRVAALSQQQVRLPPASCSCSYCSFRACCPLCSWPLLLLLLAILLFLLLLFLLLLCY